MLEQQLLINPNQTIVIDLEPFITPFLGSGGINNTVLEVPVTLPIGVNGTTTVVVDLNLTSIFPNFSPSNLEVNISLYDLIRTGAPGFCPSLILRL